MGIGGRLGSGAGSEKCESQHSRALFRTRMSSEEEGATMKTVWRLLIDEPEVTLHWMTSNERIAIGWGEIGDVLHLGSLDAIAEAIRERNENHPDHAGKPAANVQHGCNSLMTFVSRWSPATWSSSVTEFTGGAFGKWWAVTSTSNNRRHHLLTPAEPMHRLDVRR